MSKSEDIFTDGKAQPPVCNTLGETLNGLFEIDLSYALFEKMTINSMCEIKCSKMYICTLEPQSSRKRRYARNSSFNL